MGDTAMMTGRQFMEWFAQWVNPDGEVGVITERITESEVEFLAATWGLEVKIIARPPAGIHIGPTPPGGA